MSQENEVMSEQRPKSLAESFEEEASRDSKEKERAALKVINVPTVVARKKAKKRIPPSEIHHNKLKRKAALRAAKPSHHRKGLLSKVKKETKPRRSKLNSPFGLKKKKKNSTTKKQTGQIVTNVKPLPRASQSKANHVPYPDSDDSWDGDWDDVSENGLRCDSQTDSFDEENTIERQTVAVTDSDEELAVGKDENVRSRIDWLPRNGRGKRWWWLAAFLAAALVFGGGFKGTVPQYPTFTIMALMRQKKNLLPSPVRLTGKNPPSFSMEATTTL